MYARVEVQGTEEVNEKGAVETVKCTSQAGNDSEQPNEGNVEIQRNVYAVEVVFKYAICSGRFGPLGEPLPTNSGVLHCGRLKIADFDLGVLYNPEARDEPCVEHWISTINAEFKVKLFHRIQNGIAPSYKTLIFSTSTHRPPPPTTADSFSRRSDDHPQPRQLRRPTPPLQSSLRRKIQRNVYAVEVVFKYAICSGRFGPLGEPLPTNSGVLHCGRLKIADFDLGVLYNPEARDEPCVEHWISTINGEQTP
ncbi:hypothetical protein RHMOL_Rhmol06G0067500 [Rhododendron molle]|uniref:Uncharacterized protein n=2 Tax=Rhododendron molle TaxID=49168 RepID=A0ACC0N9U7_RHOML|nr:hypothetical protein RHMOL_Rhmol06G0067500 [Rhododendron molle]KAI8549975.1 hypothetical protein RHMOL_Rhmol06G0067500 [Rhododendron molle]